MKSKTKTCDPYLSDLSAPLMCKEKLMAPFTLGRGRTFGCSIQILAALH